MQDYSPAITIDQSLYGAFADATAAYPENPALLYMGVSVTFSQLGAQVSRAADGLYRLGVRAGDAVTICLPNVPDAVALLYAVGKLGAVAHLVHPLTTPEQMRGCLTKIDTKLFAVLHTAAAAYLPLADELGVPVISCDPSDPLPLFKRLIYHAKTKTPPPRGRQIPFKALPIAVKDDALPTGDASLYPDPKTLGEATAVLLHSGGTSGAPKTIALSARAVNSLSAKGLYALGTARVTHKYMLSVLPMFHGFGLCMGVHAMLCHGGCNAIMPKFDPKAAVALLRKNKMNFVIGVPVLYEALLRQPKFCGDALKNIDVAFVGGDFVSHAFLKKTNGYFEAAGSTARLFEGYGLTETVTVCAVNTHRSHRDGSVGQALPGLKIEAFEDSVPLERGKSGELYVSGDTLMTGYLGDAAATEDAFFTDRSGVEWVRTGDFGYVDADGFVFFRQRIKRIVKVSGVSVYPFEIEQLVSAVEGVKNVCALSVPDARHGEMIQLYVATPLESDAEREALASTIREQIRSHVSVYALPRKIVFRKKLPATSVGKIDAEALRAEGVSDAVSE